MPINMLEANIDYSLAEMCAMNEAQLRRIFTSPSAILDGCSQLIEPVLLLHKVSIISIIVSIAILLVFKFSSSYCGTDRDKNASIFPKLIPLTVLIIAAQVLVQGISLAYLSYLIPAEVLGGIYFPVISFGIGIGAAIGFFK